VSLSDGRLTCVRVARPEDTQVDAEVLELMLLRRDRVRHSALLLVPHRERVTEVEDEPTGGGDVPAERCIGETCLAD